MTIGRLKRPMPGGLRTSCDELYSSRDWRCGERPCARSAAFGTTERPTVCELLGSWGSVLRIATFVVVVWTVVVMGLWLLRIEISAGPVHISR